MTVSVIKRKLESFHRKLLSNRNFRNPGNTAFLAPDCVYFLNKTRKALEKLQLYFELCVQVLANILLKVKKQISQE